MARYSSLARRDGWLESPIRTFGLGIGALEFVPPQPPGWSFLAWARAGSISVMTHDRSLIAHDGSAVWIPEGIAFGIGARAACDLRIAYVARGAIEARRLAAVRATPILREILERAVTTGYLDPCDGRDARLIAVALDELRALDEVPPALELALPNDVAMRAAVERVFDDAGRVVSVRVLAFAAGMSVRTFERRFAAETGLTPRVWLRRARLHAASAALAAGASITDAGFSAGYASPSAFIAAYRRQFGAPPGRARRERNRPIE